MTTTKHILALSGSLRKGSYNSALLRALQKEAPGGITVDIIQADEIRAIPLYDQDVESVGFPETVAALKARIRAADGIIIATPEYNRSMPGVLKNSIDWTSRPYGDNAWKGKPVYVIGASVGPTAAALAQYALKQVMLYLDARVLGQPEFYCGNAGQKFDEQGALLDEKTKEFITTTAWPGFLDFIG